MVTYVKDMKIFLCADGMNILVLDKKEEILQLNVETLMKQLELWFSMNELIFNIKKTRVISFRTNHFRHPCRASITYKDMGTRYSSAVLQKYCRKFKLENSHSISVQKFK